MRNIAKFQCLSSFTTDIVSFAVLTYVLFVTGMFSVEGNRIIWSVVEIQVNVLGM